MLYNDKTFEFRDFPINQEYGIEESFFRVITPDGEVQLPKLPFQLNKPLPEVLNCRVKTYNGGIPVITHNMPRYVNEFYADGFSRGQEFEFRVVGLPDDGSCNYRLTDENGLIFKLYEPKASLVRGQSVKCKFKTLDQNVFLLQRSNTDTQFPMLTLRDFARIAAIHSVNATKIENFLREIPEMFTALDEYEHGRPVWVVTAIRALKPVASRIFREAATQMHPDIVFDAINGMRNVLLYLLQGSGFLKNIKGNERISLQSEITLFLEQLDVFDRALDIISKRSYNKFINTLLSNLKESGYLYHPTTQFSILMILFRISPELVNSSLGRIFDTLMGWDPETWKTEPFRQAFVEQLEIYITETREDIDRFLKAETQDDNEKIEKVLTAIAIQNALALPSDSIDMRLNLSLFYRYLSLLRSAKSDVLLNKSYLTLMGVRLPVDFTWSDIKETAMMMTRAAVDPPANARLPENPRYYLNGDIEVEIGPEGINVRKVTDVEENNVIYNEWLHWLSPKVYVKLARSLSHSKLKTMDGHAEHWTNIENALFRNDVAVETVTKLTPDIGDRVRIIIEDVKRSPDDYKRALAMYCRIVDDNYIEGEGIMYANDIVNYNLYGVSAGTFRFDNGDHMIFEATVIGIDENDRYLFSLEEATHDAIRDLANVGDSSYCVVTKDNGRSYSAISERGYGLFLRKDNDGTAPFRPGSRLRVTVIGYDHDAVQGVIDDGPFDDYDFNNARALRNLMLAIAIDKEGNVGQEILLDDDELVSREDMIEIIEILRYKAVASLKNIMEAFDYLSFAHLLSLVIGNDALAAEIKAHKDILLLHQHYATNKSIFAEDVQLIVDSAPDSILIQRMARRLSMVAAMGDVEQNAWLWDSANNSTNEAEREIAHTVLSYNLLYEINRDDETIPALKEKIAQKLNVDSEQRNLKYYGSESQYVEFKSSLVYPAQKGKKGVSLADPDKQEFEILHIIAGFLNTEGGTLYIGVSDEHYEIGLNDDLNFYKIDNSERNTLLRRNIRSLDNIANYLQILIDTSFNLAKNAGEYAKASVDDESTKGVIVVKIKPCPRVITLDGTIYVRHGSKTEPLLSKEDIEIFRADRESLYKRLLQSSAEATMNQQPSLAAEPAKPSAAINDSASSTSASDDSYKQGYDFSVATSSVRSNILHDWDDEEHFVQPIAYILFINDSEYMVTDQVWGGEEADSRLILTVKADEANDFLVMAFEGETAIKVRMRDILDKPRNTPLPHYSDRKLVFASPASLNSGVYSLHCNAKATFYERITSIDRIAQGSMTTTPERILEAECASTPVYEIIPAQSMAKFSDIMANGMKRTQIGQLAKVKGMTRPTQHDIHQALINNLNK